MNTESKKSLKRGNVVFNSAKGRKGMKEVVWQDREMTDDEIFVSEKPHEDNDFSYICTSDYCKCNN